MRILKNIRKYYKRLVRILVDTVFGDMKIYDDSRLTVVPDKGENPNQIRAEKMIPNITVMRCPTRCRIATATHIDVRIIDYKTIMPGQ